MKNKIFYPYALIEFALFAVYTVFAMMESAPFSPNYLLLACLALNIIFMVFSNVEKALDRAFGIAVSSLFFLSALFSFIYTFNLEFITLSYFSSIYSYLAFILLLIYLNLKVKTNVLIEVLFIVVFGGVLVGLTYIFKTDSIKSDLLTSFAWSYALIFGIMIYLIFLSIKGYKNTPMNKRPNFFFLGVSIAFMLVIYIAMIARPLLNSDSTVISLLSFFQTAFIIPSYILLTISFMLFEPREA